MHIYIGKYLKNKYTDGFHRRLIQYHLELQKSLKLLPLLCIWGSELKSLAERMENAENLKI